MSTIITATLVSKLKPTSKQYDVRDSKLTGFLIRVNPSGNMKYVCEYRRGKRVNIGSTSVLTPTQARDRAKEILGDAVKGIAPKANTPKSKNITFKSFVEGDYKKWMITHKKRGQETITRLSVNYFAHFGAKPLTDFTCMAVEKWRTRRIEAGKKPTTVNRDITALKASLAKAIQWGLLDTHPLANLKPLKTDKSPKIRYLNIEEENNLRQALNAREIKLQLSNLAPYLKPMIILSLNTGLRRGELLSLKWENINFSLSIITLEGSDTKNQTTRHIPLNKEAYESLQNWKQKIQPHTGLVFPNKEGSQLCNVKKAWNSLKKSADLKNFRWHDMRHHFASRLVMVGVDLNTVRELLGHADIKTTLRYAHLAPEHKAAAVAKLNIPATSN